MGNDSSKRERALMDFKQTLSDRMTRYFTDIEAKVLRFNIASDVENDIFESVYTIIRRIVREMENLDDRFQLAAKGIIEVEHYYSAAKIISLNPFNFLLVIEELSQDTAVTLVHKNRGVADGLCEVFIKDPNLQPRWQKYSPYERYNDNKLRTGTGLLSEFNKLVHQAIVNLQRSSKDRVHSKSGKLFIHKHPIQYGAHPAMNIRLEWNDDLVIMVCVTPVLRCNGIQRYYSPEEATSSTFYEAVVRTGSFLLVPEANRDVFKMSFVEAEHYIMRTVISDNYLSAFRLLVYLIDGRNMFKSENLKMIDDFTVKMVILSEAESNWRRGYTDIYVDDCVIQMLNKLSTTLSSSAFIANVFLKDDNVVRFHEYDSRTIERNKKGLAGLIDHLVDDVSEPEEYDFDDIFYRLCPLNETVQSYPPRDMVDSFKLQGTLGRTLEPDSRGQGDTTASQDLSQQYG